MQNCLAGLAAAALSAVLLVPAVAQTQAPRNMKELREMQERTYRTQKARSSPTLISVQFVESFEDNRPVLTEEDREILRSRIYERAAAECGIITKAMPGTCVVKSLKINQQNNRDPFARFSVSATANYTISRQ